MGKNKVNEIKNKVVGSAEETAGKIMDDPKLQLKGKAKQGMGKVHEIADDYVHEAEDLKDTVVGTVKEKTGQITHDKPLELKGRLQKQKADSGLPTKLLYSLGILTLIVLLLFWITDDE